MKEMERNREKEREKEREREREREREIKCSDKIKLGHGVKKTLDIEKTIFTYFWKVNL